MADFNRLHIANDLCVAEASNGFGDVSKSDSAEGSRCEGQAEKSMVDDAVLHLAGTQTSTRDSSANRLAQSSICRSERELRHLAENLPDNLTCLTALGAVISEIRHEISQPLHAIANFAEAGINVLEGNPAASPPNLLGWLKQISEQANRVTQIIGQAGRLAHKTPMRRSVVNINKLVRDCIKLVNTDLRMREVSVRCEFSGALPLVVADAVQILLVLLNLIRNAIDAVSANAAGDRELRICTETLDDTVRVCIRDNSNGLDPKSTHKLFEPSVTAKPASPCLGVSFCQSIVRLHAGRLWAALNADGGATFYLTLPARKEDVYAACADL